MIYTYTTKESAIAAIPEFCEVNEQDVFVVHVKYQSGDEYSLRKRDEIFHEDAPSIVYKFFLPIEHTFKDRDNALREGEVWKQRLGEDIELERHTRTEKGYKIFSHYSLNVVSHV